MKLLRKNLMDDSTHKFGEDEIDQDRKMWWKPCYVYAIGMVFFWSLGLYCIDESGISLKILETVYFCAVTFTTVGYGDVTFDTEYARFFGIVFVGIGTCLTGPAISAIIGYAASGVSESDDADWDKIENGGWKKEDSPAFEDRASAMRQLKQDFVLNRKAMVWNAWKAYLRIEIIGLLGALVMMWLEGWSLVTSLYFSTVTITTVGFGDVVPKTLWGKAFVTCFILVSTYMVANAIGILSSLPVDLRRLSMTNQVLSQFGFDLHVSTLKGLMQSRLLAFIRHGDPDHAQLHAGVTMPEFVLWLLIKQRRIDSASVETAMRLKPF